MIYTKDKYKLKKLTLKEFKVKSLWSIERMYSFYYMLTHCSGKENNNFCLAAFVVVGLKNLDKHLCVTPSL